MYRPNIAIKVRVIKCPTKEHLRPSPQLQERLRDIFALEKRSSESLAAYDMFDKAQKHSRRYYSR